MADNVIQLTITADSTGLTKGVQQAAAGLKTLESQGQTVGKVFDFQAEKSARLANQIRPLAGAFGNLTSQLAQTSGALAPVVNTIDNFTFRAIQASSGAKTLGQALLQGLGAVFSPVNLAIVGITTALSLLIGKFVESRKAKDDFDKAMKSGDIGFFQTQLDTAKKDLDAFEKKFVEVQNRLQAAPQGSPLQQRQAVGIAQLDAERAAKTAQVTKAENDLAEARRTNALKGLPELNLRLEAENKLVGLSERAQIAKQAEIVLSGLKAKGLKDEDLEETKLLLTRQAQLKTGDLINKTNRAYLDGVKARINAIDTEIIKLTQGEAAARRFADARAREEIQRKTGVTVKPDQQGQATLDEAERRLLRTRRDSEVIKDRERAIDQDLLEMDLNRKEAHDALVNARKATIDNELARELVILNGQRDVLSAQLDIAHDKNAPATALLDLAIQLDDTERKILEKQILQKEALADQLEALGKIEEAEVARAEAQAMRGKADSGTVGRSTNRITDQLGREEEAFQQRLGDTIGEGVIAGLKHGGKGIKEFFAKQGEGVVKDLVGSLFGAKPQSVFGQAIGRLLQPSAQQTLPGVPTALDPLTSSIKSVTNAFGKLDLSTLDLGKSFGSLIGGFGDLLSSGMSGLGSLLGSGASGIGSLLSGLGSIGSSLFGGLGSGIGSLFGLVTKFFGFAEGGTVLAGHGSSGGLPPWILNNPRIPHFAQGGVVKGPVVGIIGEGGEDEHIIPDSKMRRMKGGKREEAAPPNIYLVDNRPPRLGPNDVVMYVSDSLRRGGDVAKGVQQVIQRNR